MSLPLAAYSADVTAWAALGVVTVVMLAIDLFVFARNHEPSVKESAVWSAVWLAVAILFGGVMWALAGGTAGSEYLAGYLLERSLSLDNIFVFAVIFSYFAVPPAVQPKVLSWGIALALVLRLAFILVGATLLNSFHVAFYAFGLLLIYTAWKLARHEDTDVRPENNLVLRLVGGRVSPLFAVFVVVATTDVIFAVDSIPAIFAITTAPFVVFAANAFAMLGLRALYFLLVGVMDRFVYLSQGLAVILGIIGAKMLLIDVWHPPIWLSLAAIVVVLGATAALSVRATGRDPSRRERQAA
jgi:tellurite resistance protein TerC